MARTGEISRKWHLIDADGQVLGRMATRIADLLRGKGKAEFTPHVDTGDFVVVINAAKVKLTGKKDLQKTYTRYSGYPGGLKTIPVARVRERHPERLVEHAVAGMMPKNKLGRALLSKLKVYAGSEHPHAAQKPAAAAR
ncbi:MAG: 50S ribosomal protein L13 [Candidatus Aureabacteria bacterium]|jgi:large subunit ribosomal protein L13|nr:50S ribosomal protein L13 [Candidatus Auribacterota bacterium]NLW95084.1 50S ribosomal protein L13 [Chlamydiota bacterium]HOE26204.1 50S ribosomal protein L13 [bacterium]HQM52791.1 50S ribosomal protein L13 [bacterium]